MRGPWLATSIVAVALLSGCSYERSVNDEFDGPAGPPDTGKWYSKTYCNYSGSPGSGTSQACNVPSQATVDGKGYLHVRATYTTQGGGGPHWKVAHLASKAKLTPPYIVAVRAKVPPGAGMWSAPAWTTSWDNGGCAEVDVLEQLGRQPLGVNESVHNWCGAHRYVTRYSSPLGTPLAKDFHVYTAVVQADRVDYLVDRHKTATIWGSGVGTGLATPSTFHISLDVGTCGSWAGCPAPGAPPAEMVVDWFRVYGLP